jgi:hypothetical protein
VVPSSMVYVTWVYETLSSCTGIRHDDCSHAISLDMFLQGLFVLCFDSTSDVSGYESHITFPHKEKVRIERWFKLALTEPVTCVVYAEYHLHIEIDNSRNVTVEWTPLRSIGF